MATMIEIRDARKAKNAEIIRLWTAGEMTQGEIAKEVGTCRYVVSMVLGAARDDFDVVEAKRRISRRVAKYAPMYEQYLSGDSIVEIAVENNVSAPGIYSRFDQCGFKRFTRRELFQENARLKAEVATLKNQQEG